MARRSRSGRVIRWCRHHPKGTAIVATLVTLTAVIGSVSGNKHRSDDTAQDAPPRPTTSSPADATSTPRAAPRSAASAAASSVAPRPSGVRAAPADRQQRSGELATTALTTLAVKGRAARNGYAREEFGSAWTDDNDEPLGHNGCDTRNDILRRDLVDLSVKPNSHGCAVLSGTLHDPYTDATVRFVRGPSSSDVQIDHVVALSDAWQKGAARLDDRTRVNLANDPLNLLAVDGPTNSSKGDGDTATWLPPNKSYRCAYVARQIAVKARYHLWMTAAEHAAAARILTACPNQRIPTESQEIHVGYATRTAAPAPSRTINNRPAATVPTVGVDYENCDAVRAAGAAPIHRGDPGYAPHLDRDGDGTGCE